MRVLISLKHLVRFSREKLHDYKICHRLIVNFPSKTSLVPCIAFAGHSVTTFSAKKRESLFD